MKEIVNSKDAPAAIGPYSQAIKIKAQTMMFVSGQISMDPWTNELKTASIEEQVHQIMANMTKILEKGKSSLDKVVKTTIYLTDISDFAKVNEIYSQYFKVSPPARACVQVAALPRGVNVEIDAVAYA